MKNIAPGWPSLWGFGNSHAAKSTGLWLVVMPIVAKLTAEMNLLTFSLGGSLHHITLALPFKWKMLYASAVLIGAATLLYHCWCPIANRAYRNYASFKEQGKVGRSIVGMLQLVLRDERGYKHLCKKDEVLSTFLVDYMGVPANAIPKDLWQAVDSTAIRHDKEAEAFWYVWHFAERTRPLCRLTVSLLYLLGFFCLAWVLAQNIAWVWAA